MAQSIPGIDIQLNEVRPHETGEERAIAKEVELVVTKPKEKQSLVQRLLDNPAFISNLATAILIILLTVGMEIDRAVQIVDLVLYISLALGVGGASGVAARALVIPLRKLDKASK